MFENNKSINVFDLEKETLYINLIGITLIDKYKNKYKNVSAICRLLTVEEVRRINSIKNDAPIIHDTVEESVFNNCLIDFIGVNKSDIDIDASDAGLVTRVSTSIITKSIEMLSNPKEIIEQLEQRVEFIEVVSAIVSGKLNIPYTDVIKYPINKILRLYSILKVIYPNELSLSSNSSTE